MPSVDQLPSGRWRARWRDRSGRQSTAGRSFPTKTAARAYALDREAEVRRGEGRDPAAGKVTVGVWAEQWYEHWVGEPRTLSKGRGHLDKYVLRPVGDGRALGDLRLEQIDEHAVQGWVKRLEREGLAPATIAGVYRTLATCLSAAVRSRRLAHDPCVGVRLPTIPPASDFYWERSEMAATRRELTRPLDVAVFELLLGTGMRWGEMAGLHLPRWQPLRRRVAVVDVLTEERGMALKAYPKGRRRRELPVAENVVEAVAAHLAVSGAADCGLDHRGKRCSGLVLHDGGEPLSRHGWPRRVLAPALDAAGARPGSPHALRHTYASWRVLDGVPLRVVQELLGHASVRSTERYSHLAASTLDDPRLAESLRPRDSDVTQRDLGT